MLCFVLKNKGTFFSLFFSFFKPHMLAKGDPLHSVAGELLTAEAD